MSDKKLLDQPLWQPAMLGHPIPDHRHGVSVALPHWDHVVGYEEKDPAVCDCISAGYPRFLIHRDVIALVQSVSSETYALPFPSERVAEEAGAFVRRQRKESARVETLNGIHIVSTSEAGYESLKKFWQHAGMIISSRKATALMEGSDSEGDGENAREQIRQNLAEQYHCEPHDVFLHPTGMGSLYKALQGVMTYRPDARTIQLGFPYVDTLKIQEKMGAGAIFIAERGEKAAAEIDRRAQREPIAALFCEEPTNPMLMTPDLALIHPVLTSYNIPLIVDDTIATPYNVDVTPYADLIMTSLTKHLTGAGTVMGGALICNPASPHYASLKAILASSHEDLLSAEDAVVMAPLLNDFPERMAKHNAHGQFIAEKLRDHPMVERVWYPEWECREAYDALKTPHGGYSSLITFLTKNHEQTAAPIYDALEVCKGPSLGTNFTLASPFTLLAHYHELEWAAQYGVLPTMLRISIGLEDPEDLWQRFDRALSRST